MSKQGPNLLITSKVSLVTYQRSGSDSQKCVSSEEPGEVLRFFFASRGGEGGDEEEPPESTRAAPAMKAMPNPKP